MPAAKGRSRRGYFTDGVVLPGRSTSRSGRVVKARPKFDNSASVLKGGSLGP